MEEITLRVQRVSEGVDHLEYLLRFSKLELIDRHHRMVDLRIKATRFPLTKSLDTSDYLAIPSVNKQPVLELVRCGYVDRNENVIALKTVVLARPTPLSASAFPFVRGGCLWALPLQMPWYEMIEARDERRLLNLQKKLTRLKLLIIDELGFVPLLKTGAELLFEVFSQRHERDSVLATTNLLFFDE